MKIIFADTFFESLKQLNQSEQWYHWRFYRSRYYDLKRYLKSFFKYSGKASLVVPWSFDSILPLIKLHLIEVRKQMKKGYEISLTLNPKLKRIDHCIKLIDEILTYNWIHYAEKKLKLKLSPFEIDETRLQKQQKKSKKNDQKIFKESTKLENEAWNELWEIIKTDGRGWWE